jgi:hypothetical protein
MRVYASLEEAQRGVWWAHSYAELFAEHVHRLIPPPTAIIMNQKPWVTPFRKSTIIADLPAALKSALKVADSVLWLQGAPTMQNKRADFALGPVDSLVRDVLCNPRHAQHVSVAREGRVVTCKFVEFPEDLRAGLGGDVTQSFYDPYHFSDSAVYLRRNQEALKAAGVTHHLD